MLSSRIHGLWTRPSPVTFKYQFILYRHHFSGVVMFCLIAALFIASCSRLSAQGLPQIEWELENSFRLFLDPQHTKLHREAYSSLTEEEKQWPILSVERKLSSQFSHGWAEKMYTATCWDPVKNNYLECRGIRDDFLHPKSHNISVFLKDAPNPEGTCEWSLFKLSESVEVLDRKTALCRDKLNFEIPFPQKTRLEVTYLGQKLGVSEIKIKDIFVVGIGDSFGAGEGNPDAPVRFTDDRDVNYGSHDGIALSGFPARDGEWQNLSDKNFYKNNAGWSSVPCHRSLYSHHLRTALQLSVEDPRRAVTFVGFACTGSETTLGLLDPYKGNEWVKYRPEYSQVSYAAGAMCGPHPVETKTYGTTFNIGGRLPMLENLSLASCERGKERKIDLLFVSIGGNDIGFSRLIANSILKDDTTIKQLGGWVGQIYTVKDAKRDLENLKYRYKALNRAIHTILHIPWEEADRVILTAYPPIGFAEDGSACPDGPKGMDLHPVFSVDSNKVRAGEVFALSMTTLMEQTAKEFQWSFVSSHRETFMPRGYCAQKEEGGDPIAESLDLPKKENGMWGPYKPSEFKPYTSRQRWVWTPNDVFMLAHTHGHQNIMRKVLKNRNFKEFQLIYAGTYGGSFHPTAEGQAAIADAVLPKAREILAKYDR